jgi:putative two-component system response regulator
MGEKIALAHHEKWDGSGYPDGIAGEDIPLVARICSVVDFYDALTMDRPYRAALPSEKVVGMMRDASGTHFDPALLDEFLDVLHVIREIQAAHP